MTKALEGNVSHWCLSIYGGLERAGLGRSFLELGKQLLKREGRFGEFVFIGYEDDEEGSESSLAQQKGLAG